MEFISGFATNVGIKKSVNQDAICLLEAKYKGENISFATVCDGMGGLKDGEIASASAVKTFSDWFKNTFPIILSSGDFSRIRSDWNNLISRLNQELYDYGIKNNCQTGTTLTSALLLGRGQYFIAHIGDSRAYIFTSSNIIQLTEDQTFVAREVKRGHMTKEQAENDPRKNVLLQCIGVSKDAEPEFLSDSFVAGDSFIICSDGFRHKVREDEMRECLIKNNTKSESSIQNSISVLIDENIRRGETDNISAIYIKAAA